VPTHIAGYLKRLLRAFKSGVPARKLVLEMGSMVQDVTPDVVRWFERLCASRLIAPATETADGVHSQQRVSLSADEIDRMLPMSCPPNWSFTSFFDIIEEEGGQSALTKTTMVDLLDLQLHVCEMLSEGQAWAHIVHRADELLRRCLQGAWEREAMQLNLGRSSATTEPAAAGTSHEQITIERIYMRYMVEFGTVWHGWFCSSSNKVPPEDRDMLACLIHALRLQLDEMRASLRKNKDLVDPFDDFYFDFLSEWMDLDGEESVDAAVSSSSSTAVAAVAAAAEVVGPNMGTAEAADEADSSWRASLDDSMDFGDLAMESSSSSSSSSAYSSGPAPHAFDARVKPEYQFKPSNPMVASFAKMMFRYALKATEGSSPANAAGVATGAGDEDVAMQSDLASLTKKMRQFFSIDSVATLRNSFFPIYYRNPKHSLRGFPSLDGGNDYSKILGKKSTGGGLQDHVVLDIRLESSPGGGVWVAANICAQDAGACSLVMSRSCASLSELMAWATGTGAIVVEATPDNGSGVPASASASSPLAASAASAAIVSMPPSGVKKVYSAALQPRAWKYTGKLHSKGERGSKRFVLRVFIWVFSPRGIGVLATQVDSPAFKLSSTQHLRKQNKRESSDVSDAATAEGDLIYLKKQKVTVAGGNLVHVP
jgi:hypothetical protein